MKLIVRRLRHTQQVIARLGGCVAARMALKKPHAKPLLQRVDMADDRCVMHAQHLRRAADRAHPRHVKGGAHLVPVVHGLARPARNFTQPTMRR